MGKDSFFSLGKLIRQNGGNDLNGAQMQILSKSHRAIRANLGPCQAENFKFLPTLACLPSSLEPGRARQRNAIAELGENNIHQRGPFSRRKVERRYSEMGRPSVVAPELLPDHFAGVSNGAPVLRQSSRNLNSGCIRLAPIDF